jgi:hypothetical protein
MMLPFTDLHFAPNISLATFKKIFAVSYDEKVKLSAHSREEIISFLKGKLLRASSDGKLLARVICIEVPRDLSEYKDIRRLS